MLSKRQWSLHPLSNEETAPQIEASLIFMQEVAVMTPSLALPLTLRWGREPLLGKRQWSLHPLSNEETALATPRTLIISAIVL